MFYLFCIWFLSVVGVGFTLLNYSADGDLKNARFFTNHKNVEDAIERLKILNRSIMTEVTWNTTLFVSLASSFAFFALAPMMVSKDQKILGWVLSVFIVFGLQDLVFRWKKAHRKNKLFFETDTILNNLLVNSSKITKKNELM